MATKIPPHILPQLKDIEKDLRAAVAKGQTEIAVECATKIQMLFAPDRKHHRLLQAKLWAFEACLDENRLRYAESGFTGIRQIAAQNTRLYLEATGFLAICLLRQKQVEKAKPLIREVVQSANNIRSERRRRQFQKRFIARIEEECVLSELIGTGEASLDPKAIHEKAVLLLQQNDQNELTKLIGNLVPLSGVLLLRDVRTYSILQLPPPDRKLLPPLEVAETPKNLGKRALAVLRRIAWRAICDPDSSIYKAWSKRLPKVFNEGYFAVALVTTFGNWQIGIPLLVSGVAAIIMKYSAHEFCEWAKPRGLMIPVNEKELDSEN
ncbi:MAG: hypothetical protein KOO62_08140 [candidate division Zixibacteria bacterium]|nr:hypothetical protein [candidate division Zixibacteria bacterium]